MKRKHCDWEGVFAHIWDCADEDGLWDGSAASVAKDFDVSEDRAHEILAEIAHRGLVEEVWPERWAITKWPESDESRATWLDL